MTTTLPFDPPYKTKRISAQGERWVEVRVDGTEVDTAAPPSMTHIPTNAAPKKANAPGEVSRQVAAMLNVPFAEKEEAKRLGARWDAKNKKWYAPLGTDLGPFSRWLSS
ncbi:MAG TPA: DUF5710 domain-containing protein [Telluria sp.]